MGGEQRSAVDLMALEFLRDGGPHVMGPIETEEELCAGLVFADLCREGFAASTKLEAGHVEWRITSAGMTKLQARMA